MTIQLLELPYAINALEPYISSKTLEFHYGKHHAAYVKNVNEMVVDTPFANATLEEIIAQVSGKPEYQGLFNNAAQAWNHTFFWNSLTPVPENKKIPPVLLEKINVSFGSLDGFKETFKKAAVSQFGSGWAWLVSDKGNLKIVTTSNAGTPITSGLTPLLCIDVWEHAYYLDYQNRRPDFAGTTIDNLLNWKFALENYQK